MKIIIQITNEEYMKSGAYARKPDFALTQLTKAVEELKNSMYHPTENPAFTMDVRLEIKD